MTNTHIVYGLRRRGTAEIRYVGLTSVGMDLRLRRYGYKTYTENSKYHVHNWIRSVGIENVEMVVLDESPERSIDYLRYAEKYWEDSLRDLGHRLTNMIPCGTPNPRMKGAKHPLYGKGHTLESRGKISENHADVSGSRNPNYGKGLHGVDNPGFGKPLTEDRKSNIRIGQQESVKVHRTNHTRTGLTRKDCVWCSYSTLYGVEMSDYIE